MNNDIISRLLAAGMREDPGVQWPPVYFDGGGAAGGPGDGAGAGGAGAGAASLGLAAKLLLARPRPTARPILNSHVWICLFMMDLLLLVCLEFVKKVNRWASELEVKRLPLSPSSRCI